jgi:ElaB/YqjD/DUF883 family membrane-anchored ribosome-binding protein
MSDIGAKTGSEVSGSRTSTVDPVGEARDQIGSGQSATEQTKEKVQEGAELVQEKAQELKGTAGERVREEVGARSTQVGSQLQGTAAAMRRTTEQLRQEGNESPAKAMDFVAERAERFGGYLTGANADQILRDVEAFARRQPWLAAVGGAAAGFFAARFLKASSSARYHTSLAGTGSRQAWQPQPSIGERSSLDAGAVAATRAQQSSAEPVLNSPRGSSNG